MSHDELLDESDLLQWGPEADATMYRACMVKLADALRAEMAAHYEAAEWQKAKAEWIDVAARTLAAQVETEKRLEARLAYAEHALRCEYGLGSAYAAEHFAKYPEKP